MSDRNIVELLESTGLKECMDGRAQIRCHTAAYEITRLARRAEQAEAEAKWLRGVLEDLRDDDLVDLHEEIPECVHNGGTDGCLACIAQWKIGEALDVQGTAGGLP